MFTITFGVNLFFLCKHATHSAVFVKTKPWKLNRSWSFLICTLSHSWTCSACYCVSTHFYPQIPCCCHSWRLIITGIRKASRKFSGPKLLDLSKYPKHMFTKILLICLFFNKFHNSTFSTYKLLLHKAKTVIYHILSLASNLQETKFEWVSYPCYK